MRIRYKLSLSISMVLIVLGIVLNIAIRNILLQSMEKDISVYLKQIMKGTREVVKYRLMDEDYESLDASLMSQAEYITNYISINYDCDVDVKSIDGEIFRSNINEYEDDIEQLVDDVKEGQAIVNIKYTNSGVDGILSYPIYIDEEYIGIIDIVKNYDDKYHSYDDMNNIISIAEIVIFIDVCVVVFILTRKITKPITNLTKAVKNIGIGNYDVNINTKGNDEVAILSREFINMTDKIREQIETIEHEKEKVETLAKSRKEFFDNVTHEIKTPLTAITGYAEMIKENIVEDEEFKKKAINRIYDESERLNLLVLDLITVSKGLSTVQGKKEEVDMAGLINQICDDMKIKADKYGINIERNISNGAVIGNKNKLREVVINIVDNAIKYSEGRKKIKVTSYLSCNYYIIEVINNSIPIPEYIYNNIFEPLVKTNNDKENQSSGLGLFLCKEIIDDHGGNIAVKNGQEIHVKVTLPII